MTDILGNEKLIRSLKRMAASGHVSHGYIFSGEAGTGKMMAADYFAAMLECTGEGEKPCGRCLSCLQWQTKNQPDIVYVTHEKPNLISVDDIREGIIRSVSIKPYNGPYKIYIVDDAEKMNVQAQNALLKTLEEPPEYVIIMLLSANADGFLDTILSRSVRMEVHPLDNQAMTAVLLKKGLPPEQIAAVLPLSGGSAGKAMELSENETVQEMVQAMTDFLRNIRRAETKEILAFSAEMAKFKNSFDEEMAFFRLWFRDIFVYKCSHDEKLLTLQKEASAIRETAEHMEFCGINEVMKAFDIAEDRIKANVNTELTQEILMISIREQIG